MSMNNDKLNKGMKLLKKLPDSALIVGGAVRDYLIGHDINDVDIAVGEDISKSFKSYDIGKSKEFGIVSINHDSEIYEVAQFRAESDYSNGRHPNSVEFISNFKADSTRRDFTINAMGMDSEGHIIDYHNGISDIENKIIRTVGEPQVRFSEDYIRMLRAVRFSSRYCFDIEQNTLNAIKNNAYKIKNISVERVLKELVSMASEDGVIFARSIELLKETNLLVHILPEVDILSKFKHSISTHPEGAIAVDKNTYNSYAYNKDVHNNSNFNIIKGSVFDHVISALKHNNVCDYIVNLSILFHDVGKAKTCKIANDKISYHSHDKCSVELIDDISSRLHMSNKLSMILKFVAGNHMRMHNLEKMRTGKILSLVTNKYWKYLKDTSYADEKSRLWLYNDKAWKRKMSVADGLINENIEIKNNTSLITGNYW